LNFNNASFRHSSIRIDDELSLEKRHPILLFAHIIFLGGLLNFLIYINEILKEPEMLSFLVGKFFQNFKMDKKNVQKRKGEKSFPEIHVFAA
jgi:hypothetical protein